MWQISDWDRSEATSTICSFRMDRSVAEMMADVGAKPDSAGLLDNRFDKIDHVTGNGAKYARREADRKT